MAEKNRRILKKLFRKRKEGAQNADLVPQYGVSLGASGSSAPWTPSKGLASKPRLYDKPLKDGAILQILQLFVQFVFAIFLKNIHF